MMDNKPATILAAAAVVGLTILSYQHGKRIGQSESQQSRESNDGSSVVPPSLENGACSSDNHGEERAAGAAETKSTNGKSNAPDDDLDMLPIYPIGTLRSIYRLCVGTPRQGMLAPHSRGIITFHKHKVSKDSILELQHFSHVFVVFVFHLNSNTNVRQNTFDDKKNRGQRQFPSKIAPPSLGGKKVGVFSTRTPHRPNPIGFSLCKLDKVVVDSGNSGGSTFSLLLSGLDIVDGTPILDIKPYVPHYDCVGYDPLRLDGGSTQGNNDLAASTLTNSNNNGVEKESNPSNNASEGVRVPYWVDSGLQKRRKVTFLPEANRFLDNLMTPSSSSQSLLDSLQFYGPKCQWKDSPSDAVEHLRNCMHELLGVDVRSAWQTKKARKGKFQAERSSRVKDWKENNATVGIDANGDSASNFCSQQIDNLLLKYTIEEPGSALMGTLDERSKGSGAEDIVVVHSISIINSNAR